MRRIGQIGLIGLIAGCALAWTGVMTDGEKVWLSGTFNLGTNTVIWQGVSRTSWPEGGGTTNAGEINVAFTPTAYSASSNVESHLEAVHGKIAAAEVALLTNTDAIKIGASAGASPGAVAVGASAAAGPLAVAIGFGAVANMNNVAIGDGIENNESGTTRVKGVLIANGARFTEGSPTNGAVWVATDGAGNGGWSSGTPGWSLYGSGNVVMTQNMVTVCGYNTVARSNSVVFNAANYSAQPTYPGMYVLTCTVMLAGSSTTVGLYAYACIYRNSSIIAQSVIFATTTSPRAYPYNLSAITYAGGNDIYTVRVANYLGNNVTNTGSATYKFDGLYIGKP